MLVYPSPEPNPSSTSKKFKSIAPITAIAASSATVVVLWVVIVVYFSRSYCSFHVNLLSATSSSNTEIKKADEAVANPSNVTLKTRFCTYYRALLPSGAAYFIKKINRLDKMFSLYGNKRLDQELHNLANLFDPNLMIPFGYLLTLRGVYLFCNFFAQGTLFKNLHHAEGSTLDWENRYTIVWNTRAEIGA